MVVIGVLLIGAMGLVCKVGLIIYEYRIEYTKTIESK